MPRPSLPPTGLAKSDVLAALDAMRSQDADWRRGRTTSLVYYAGDDVLEVAQRAYLAYFQENALNPMAFPSLRRMENEVLGIVSSLFHGGEDARGSMTSGGSESILMAVKTARERARAERPEIPAFAWEMLLPASAHPAFDKAAHYLGVKVVRVPLGPDFRADAAAARRLASERTILVVGSAFAYPHGVLDPIGALAEVATERNALMHVDACLGGLLLPFLERLGNPLPAYDFRVPGVTSISADLHKYGFTAKGASTILYRDKALRRYQFFVESEWPGGLYGSPTATGTRPGGAIAAAWAVLQHLGLAGYMDIATRTMAAASRIMAGVRETPGLRILGAPEASVFAFTSDDLDVFALGEALQKRGWYLDRQQLPPALHMMVTPAHGPHAEQFLSDLRACVEEVRTLGPAASEGAAAMYGMMATFEDRATVKQMVLEFMDGLDDIGMTA